MSDTQQLSVGKVNHSFSFPSNCSIFLGKFFRPICVPVGNDRGVFTVAQTGFGRDKHQSLQTERSTGKGSNCFKAFREGSEFQIQYIFLLRRDLPPLPASGSRRRSVGCHTSAGWWSWTAPPGPQRPTAHRCPGGISPLGYSQMPPLPEGFGLRHTDIYTYRSSIY